MLKHILVIFSEDQHKEKISKTLENLVGILKEHKKKGELKNTWYNIHESSYEEWKRENRKQAHEIALMQVLGDKRGDLKEENLTEDTKKRIAEAKERILRSMT